MQMASATCPQLLGSHSDSLSLLGKHQCPASTKRILVLPRREQLLEMCREEAQSGEHRGAQRCIAKRYGDGEHRDV